MEILTEAFRNVLPIRVFCKEEALAKTSVRAIKFSSPKASDEFTGKIIVIEA